MAIMAVIACAAVDSSFAGAGPDEAGTGRRQLTVRPDSLIQIDITLRPSLFGSDGMAEIRPAPPLALGCDNVTTHTDFDFDRGGALTIQAGFEQGEIAASSYTLAPEDFPLKIKGMEMIFATENALVETVTEWSVILWDGNPDEGQLVFQVSSDDVLIPHLRVPPGTHAVNVSVSVDPDDPEQLFVLNNSGIDTFSVGFRVDRHNRPGSPCLSPPHARRNAFPTTDVSGLNQPTRNWIAQVNGTFCLCYPDNGPWARFIDLPSGDPFPCRPSGDWIMRANWSRVSCEQGVGACCLPDETCELLQDTLCADDGGVFMGDGTVCDDVVCPAFTRACCLTNGNCVDVSAGQCELLAGTPGDPGSECATWDCDPSGACCMIDGSCTDGLSAEECDAGGGVYQGNRTVCANVECPEFSGACCAPNGACVEVVRSTCDLIEGDWHAPPADCADGNNNQRADVCEACVRDPSWQCDGDVDGDGQVNPVDSGLIQSAFGSSDEQDLCNYDLDCDGQINPVDAGIVQSLFGTCEPVRSTCP
jgi:hypothetical protein